MFLSQRQFIACVMLSASLLVLIIRLVQKGRLDIAYCWVWLLIGTGSLIIVIKYEWLTSFSSMIGSLTNTTTVFLIGIFILLLMSLQFSLVISSHRRQIKKLSQAIALMSSKPNSNDAMKEKDKDVPV